MFNSTVIDVGIGLAFVYLLLGLICTTVSEWISGKKKLRATMLEEAIRNLLDAQKMPGGAADTAFLDNFYGHPIVAGLKRGKDHPSYLPARTFATAVMDLMTPGHSGTISFDDLEKGASGLPDGDVKRAILALLQNANRDLGRAQKNIEDWFDDAMARVSGWYKRNMQVWTVIVAFVITIFVNADTISIAQRLWADPPLRSKVVEAAKVRAQKPRPSVTVEYTNPDDPTPTVPAKVTSSGDEITDEDRAALGQIVGWSDDLKKFEPSPTGGSRYWLGTALLWLVGLLGRHLIGWTITGIAVSLGAPFWFDTLKRFINLRSAGNPPEIEAKKPDNKPESKPEEKPPTPQVKPT